jgi:hypothetical protein
MDMNTSNDAFLTLAKASSRLAAYVTAFMTGVAVLLLSGWAVLYWLFPNQTFPWYLALTLVPLSYSTAFLLNPKGSQIKRVSVISSLVAIIVWYIAAGGGIIAYTALVTSLSAVHYVLQNQGRSHPI